MATRTEPTVVGMILDRLDRQDAEMTRRFDEQDAVLRDIRAQARLTNSRVGKLERWKARAEGFKAAFHWVEISVAAATAAGATAAVTLIIR